MTRASGSEPLRIGRYLVFDAIASGGMATVHLGRQLGAAGFARTVAIKRLHPGHAKNADFVGMFIDEARLAARIQHAHVVATLDVVSEHDELFLVMEYVAGESLAGLLRLARARDERVPMPIVSSIMAGVLHGLHAAHEATSEDGTPLGVVHRDVSPQNVLVGVDGMARVLDFGIAKANVRLTTTEEGQMKGKLAYMAPEQIRADEVTRRSDIYAGSVVLWEMCAGRRMFGHVENQGGILGKILSHEIEPLTRVVPDLPTGLHELVEKGYAEHPDGRFQTAREMALELERRVPPASPSVVGAWVRSLAHEALEERARRVALIERWSPPNEGTAQGRARAVEDAAALEAPLRFEPVDPSAVTAPDRPPVRDEALLANDRAAPAAWKSRGPKAGLGAALLVAMGIAVWVGASRRDPERSDALPETNAARSADDVHPPSAARSAPPTRSAAPEGSIAAGSTPVSSAAAPVSVDATRRAARAAGTRATPAPTSPRSAAPATPVRADCDPPTEHDPAHPDNPARLRIKPGCR